MYNPLLIKYTFFEYIFLSHIGIIKRIVQWYTKKLYGHLIINYTRFCGDFWLIAISTNRDLPLKGCKKFCPDTY